MGGKSAWHINKNTNYKYFYIISMGGKSAWFIKNKQTNGYDLRIPLKS
jgi:hypothetical protein